MPKGNAYTDCGLMQLHDISDKSFLFKRGLPQASKIRNSPFLAACKILSKNYYRVKGLLVMEKASFG